MRRTYLVALSVLTSFALAGCQSGTSSMLSTGSTSQNTNSSIETSSSSELSSNIITTSATENSSLDDEGNDSNAIVVYFSATNHTENVANYIANHLSISTFELEPVEPYTSADLNYGNQDSRVVQEHNDPNRHVELVSTTIENFSSYDYVFLGAPVWWQELSWVINDFVIDSDFTGKTIIPFGTSASSGFSTTNLVALNTTGTWLEGHRFSSSVSESTVTAWVDSLNLNI